jgi:HK97 family phage major capsid protein/HK97 family phage prohead protease
MTQLDRLEFKAAFTTDNTGAVTGKAWDFSSPDRVGDVIEPAAFAGAIGKSLPMLFAHDQAQAVGVWDSITVGSDGLHVAGKLLVDDVARAKEVRALLQAKAVTGLSVGFMTKKAAPRSGGGRTISDLDLVEVSLVAVPAHDGARVSTVKDASSMTTATAENIIDTKALDEKLAGIEAKFTARFDAIEAAANRLEAGNDNTEQTPEQKAFGAYIRRGDAGLADEDRKALTVSTDATAGFLAPTSFGSEVLKALREYSPIRQYARVITISARDVSYPRRVGSTAATWVSEIANRTESGPSYEQVTLTPYELATFVEVSRQLLEDNAYNLEGELASDLAESFAIAEATAFVGGDGSGKPKGILNATGITTVVSGAAATLGSDPGDKLIDVFSAIPTLHAQNGAWAMNRKTLAAIKKIKDTTGNYLWQPSLRDGAPSTLLGRPVIEMVDMPDIAANATPIVFGDWSGYRIVDRVDMSILSDPYTRAKNGINVFHARKRVGGDVTNPDRFVKLKIAAS